MPGSVLKAGARRLIFENSPRIFIISLVYVTLVAVVSWLSFRLPGTINIQDIYSRLLSGELPGLGILYTDFRPIGLFFAFLLVLFQPVLDFGFLSYCLKTSRKQKTDFFDLFNGFLFFVKVILLFLLIMIFTLLWSVLLIVPGIVASYRYRLAYYILLDDPTKGALQCIAESKLLMHGKKVDLLTIDLSFLGWFILDYIVLFAIPFSFAIPIISIWLAPYFGLTIAAFYEEQVANLAV
ncbi:MAG: DUF975 family protein [Oscillospiraceae bacterium]|nr:DUF975 family protein [Oscillospiraceae bacterium]